MERSPRTLFETEWQESNQPSYIMMTPENYYFPSHDRLRMIVGKVATYKNVLISVLLPSAAT